MICCETSNKTTASSNASSGYATTRRRRSLRISKLGAAIPIIAAAITDVSSSQRHGNCIFCSVVNASQTNMLAADNIKIDNIPVMPIASDIRLSSAGTRRRMTSIATPPMTNIRIVKTTIASRFHGSFGRSGCMVPSDISGRADRDNRTIPRRNISASCAAPIRVL